MSDRNHISTLCVLACLLLPTAASTQPTWPDLSLPGTAEGGGENDAAIIIGIENYAFVDDIPGPLPGMARPAFRLSKPANARSRRSWSKSAKAGAIPIFPGHLVQLGWPLLQGVWPVRPWFVTAGGRTMDLEAPGDGLSRLPGGPVARSGRAEHRVGRARAGYDFPQHTYGIPAEQLELSGGPGTRTPGVSHGRLQ